MSLSFCAIYCTLSYNKYDCGKNFVKEYFYHINKFPEYQEFTIFLILWGMRIRKADSLLSYNITSNFFFNLNQEELLTAPSASATCHPMFRMFDDRCSMRADSIEFPPDRQKPADIRSAHHPLESTSRIC